MKFDIKQVSAILFQFTLVCILCCCLFYGVGDADTIIGALIGLSVGIGINSIAE